MRAEYGARMRLGPRVSVAVLATVDGRGLAYEEIGDRLASRQPGVPGSMKIGNPWRSPAEHASHLVPSRSARAAAQSVDAASLRREINDGLAPSVVSTNSVALSTWRYPRPSPAVL